MTREGQWLVCNFEEVWHKHRKYFQRIDAGSLEVSIRIFFRRDCLIVCSTRLQQSDDNSKKAIEFIQQFGDMCSSTRLQQSNDNSKKAVEFIRQFGDMCRERLELYRAKNDSLPDVVIVYRDGIADNMFAELFGPSSPTVMPPSSEGYLKDPTTAAAITTTTATTTTTTTTTTTINFNTLRFFNSIDRTRQPSCLRHPRDTYLKDATTAAATITTTTTTATTTTTTTTTTINFDALRFFSSIARANRHASIIRGIHCQGFGWPNFGNSSIGFY